ncbi:MAG: hypothetical protein ACFFAG_09410 [Promethearchaeota archaeon]
MDKQEEGEEDFEQEFDENGFDPTKEAFFSDLMGMEEDIASEAYELVEHAINLIDSKYFDDGIEVLRQAIGLYTQINREEEIKAINEKISEVYLLKEQVFREGEIEEEKVEQFEIVEETLASDLQVELAEGEIKVDLFAEAVQLINEGKEFLENKKFEEALDKYDQAVEIFESLDKPDEVEKIFKLIEECYNKKAKFLRGVKFPIPEIETEPKQKQILKEDQLKDEKLKKYLEAKKREEEISSQAYELLGKAAELTKSKQYDEALQLYSEGSKLFQELKWDYEVEKVQETISQLENERSSYLIELEREKAEKMGQVEIRVQQEETIKQQVVEREEQEIVERLERLREMEFQKMETEFFKAQIDNMATEASRMVREYELAMQRAIKKGELIEECVYPQVIEIYKRIKELLIDKGWRNEAAIYDDTIDIYIQKFEQDKKIRQIEAEKVIKQKEAEELLKISKEETTVVLNEEQLKVLEEQRKKEVEIQNLITKIDEMTGRAEKLAREYEVALRKGKFELKCPYPEIIEFFKTVRQLSLEKGWESDAAIFLSQIQAFKEKLEKDKKLRQIEAEKVQKQIKAEDLSKIQKEEKEISVDKEKLRKIEEKKRLAEEEEKFEQLINDMVNKTEKMGREYDTEMKKAVRQGKLAENPPFEEIIQIYERVKQMVLAKGRNEEGTVYDNQINYYSQKWEKDRKLREVEAQKIQRQKELDEMQKIGIDEKKLKVIEIKREQEDFETYIADMVNKAEKLVREHENEMRKSMRHGEILESTPYSEVIEIYKQIREKVYARGWREQAEIFTNQIKIYQDKMEKHEKLLEVEAQKIQREKDLEDMHKVEKTVEIDKDKLKAIEKKREQEDFETYITDMVNKAEKLVREHESEMRKSMRSGEILESTPYSEVIEIYEQIREKVYAQGWREQAEIFTNQIKIYQDKLEKHEKLLEVEAQKIQREKDLEDMLKVEKIVENDKDKLKKLEKKKEEKDFQKDIIEMVNKAEKLEREYNSAMKKALKKGEIIEHTPYPEIIEIYRQIQNEMLERGWVDQSQIYFNQIKIYQEKLKKSEILREVEAKKAEREREIKEMHKVKEDFKPARPDKIKEGDIGIKEEDLLLDKAMNLIDEAERLVKNYEVNIKSDVLLFESPYDKAITNYNEAKNLFQEIGWNDEAGRLINTIKFYKEKQEKDEKLREIEKKKLQEPEAELIAAKTGTEKELFAKEKKILEFEKKKKDEEKQAEKIFNQIHNAERMAKEYELKIKEGFFEHEPPYEKILNIYRNARKSFEEIGWMEESMKLLNTIQFYKEKLEKDMRLRSLEIEKAKKQEEELLMQQKLLEQAKVKQERLLKKRKESLLVREEKVSEFESAKDRAFRLMDRAKIELNQNNFEKAIDLYKEGEEIFSQINWQEGINMVKDSITMIKRKQQSFELEQAAIEEKKAKQLKIEEKLEEKLAKDEELRKLQQEEKRKEVLKIQREKEWEKDISEEAYKLLEQGTKLLDKKNFEEAYEIYIEARKLFDKISWKREVSRINNDLLFKLNRERKTFEIFEDIKKKRVEEEMEMELLKKEVEKERDEHEKRKKEEKRKLAKEEFDRKILKEIERAENLIEAFKYNEGIIILKREARKLNESEHGIQIERIEKIISDVKDQTEIPLIALEPLDGIDNLGKFKATYIALDKAQISLIKKSFMKAISELKESIFHLKDLKISKKYVGKIDDKIGELQEKLGKKPKAKEKEYQGEKEILKSRIEARRKERRKKVLDLLGNSKD